MRAVGLGMALAAVNVVIIAIGLAAVAGDGIDIVTLVIMIGGIPGVLLGALLGVVAHATRKWAAGARRFVLLAPALLLVVVLAGFFSLGEFIFVASIPTTVAALLLERRTREVTPPPVPVAQVRS